MLLTPVEVYGAGLMGQTVSFFAYSWGKDRRIPEDADKPLRLWDLLQNYYGFIAFKTLILTPNHLFSAAS